MEDIVELILDHKFTFQFSFEDEIEGKKDKKFKQLEKII